MHGCPRVAGALLLALAVAPSAQAEDPLRIRASAALVPCATEAARAFPSARALVSAGGFRELAGADVFVGADVEVTRALESGAATLRSEKDVASVPWVLAVRPGNPLGLRGTADLSRTSSEVWVLAGLAGYPARQALSGLEPDRVKESEDPLALRAAAVALLPLSLAGAGERLAVDVPALMARAVVVEGSRRPDAARAFVTFLGSEPGQRLFAACGSRTE